MFSGQYYVGTDYCVCIYPGHEAPAGEMLALPCTCYQDHNLEMMSPEAEACPHLIRLKRLALDILCHREEKEGTSKGAVTITCVA